MRSYEERVAEAKRRIAEKERMKRLRRNRIAMVAAVTVCLALVVGLSFAMPGIAARFRPGDYSGFETAASIFNGSTAPSYVIVGLLAFLLGMCVTILCFHLRQINHEESQEQETEREDRHGAD